MTEAKLRIVHIAAALAMLLPLGVQTACMVGPKYHAPAATTEPPPAAYKETPVNVADSGGWKVAQPQDAMLRGKWWEIYNDPELNDLEERLNINNQNIKQAFENFMQARAMVAEARSQLFPTISTAPAYQATRSSANVGNLASGSGSGSGGATPKLQNQIFTLPISAGWEPDLWGKVRNQIHEAQYNAQVSAADLESERLSEQASLAIFLFELRGQDALQKIYEETVEADEKSVELTRARYETGVDDQLSLVEAENVLKSAQAAATNLGVARAQFEHAIAVLIGTSPSNFSITYKPVTAAPPEIPVGVPSQLLERRPDIAAAERTMAAANAQVGVAVAAYYPTLTLSGEAGFESSALGELLDWPSRFWSVGPSLSETIYDGGLRRATVRQYLAAYNGDVASYRETVLTAFQQVEDSMAAVRILSKQIQQQVEAEQSAEQFLELSRARYYTGVDTYLNVLVAQTTLLSDQLTLAMLRTQAVTASVQLIEALGGGWDRTQLPGPSEVSKPVTKSEIEAQKAPNQ
jgi:NodT family efflux transporter outer membrane factor (OMF) lipoprotein